MRIYIIGNDGITLCREPPTAVNQGEIIVASNEELRAARLSGKRLLALWNALPANPPRVGSPARWRAVARSRLTRQLEWSTAQCGYRRGRAPNCRSGESIDARSAACVAQVA
jgi:hypothetical protein